MQVIEIITMYIIITILILYHLLLYKFYLILSVRDQFSGRNKSRRLSPGHSTYSVRFNCTALLTFLLLNHNHSVSELLSAALSANLS